MSPVVIELLYVPRVFKLFWNKSVSSSLVAGGNRAKDWTLPGAKLMSLWRMQVESEGEEGEQREKLGKSEEERALEAGPGSLELAFNCFWIWSFHWILFSQCASSLNPLLKRTWTELCTGTQGIGTSKGRFWRSLVQSWKTFRNLLGEFVGNGYHGKEATLSKGPKWKCLELSM